MPRKEPEKLYTKVAAAEMLSCTPRQVQRLLRKYDKSRGREGLGPYFHISGGHRSLRIPASAIIRLQERTRVPV